MSQATSEVNPQQHTSASDMDACDTDIVPQDSSSQEDTAAVSGRPPSEPDPHDIAIGYHYTNTPTTSNMQFTTPSRVPSRQAYCQSDRLHHATPARQPPGLFKRVSDILYFSTGSSSAKSDLEEQLYLKEAEIERLQEALHGKHNTIEQISKDRRNDIDHLKKLHKALDGMEREWDAREKELDNYKKQVYRDRNETVRMLQADVREIELERNMIQEKYDTFIRKQQEESFKQMESGRWLPSEESKVVGDHDRIKREMRSWAKRTSIKDMLPLQTLDGIDHTDLMKDLSHVALLENNQLPQGLSTPKSPSLLLNALLAHDLYTHIFQNPFFFFKDGLGHDLPRAGPEDTLDEIYQFAQASNQQDAHIWRSQMLRLLLPPLRTDSKDGEKTLHSLTERMIAKVSERQALDFIAGSARHLISNDVKIDYTTKLKDIYQGAATLSYRLWTRRTTMRCVTLHEMGHPTFDADSQLLLPHTLVRYDDHDDKLRDKPITVIVHPLLEVYGTDEAKDYDKGRVWAPAEVWLDSR